MGRQTTIGWTHHTFSPWQGCSRVSSGCLHCYAENMDRRFNKTPHWGPGVPRKLQTNAYWNQPLNWNAEASAAGVRRRVFCASVADVFDAEAPTGQRERLWATIAVTPHLNWLLLTKRPQNIASMLPAGGAPPNVWLGTSVEDQDNANHRTPLLQAIPATARFLSCEPLLGPICLEEAVKPHLGSIDWIIVGGESGPNARPMQWAWARDIQAWCNAHHVPLFVKQAGRALAAPGDSKGETPASIPPDLQVRQFPDPNPPAR